MRWFKKQPKTEPAHKGRAAIFWYESWKAERRVHTELSEDFEETLRAKNARIVELLDENRALKIKLEAKPLRAVSA